MVLALCAATLLLAPPGARADGTPGEADDRLAAGRALFAEALHDQQAGRFAEAAAKFRQVRDVRDTAPVEYRIGTCEEGLGDPAQAFEAYRQAVALGQGDAASADVVTAAGERMRVLGKQVARLSLVLSPGAPADAEVQVDGVPVPAAALREPLALDPGAHVVTARGPGAVPFRSEIMIPSGSQMALTIALDSSAAQAPVGDRLSPASTGAGRRTAGWITVGAGGVLVGVAAALLVSRHLDIASLDRACPQGLCPPGANEPDLESTRQRALSEGPAAVAFGAAGVASAAVGAWLLLGGRGGTPRPASARLVPLLAPGGGGMAWTGVLQ
jgi:hypothetical protein